MDLGHRNPVSLYGDSVFLGKEKMCDFFIGLFLF